MPSRRANQRESQPIPWGEDVREHDVNLYGYERHYDERHDVPGETTTTTHGPDSESCRRANPDSDIPPGFSACSDPECDNPRCLSLRLHLEVYEP